MNRYGYRLQAGADKLDAESSDWEREAIEEYKRENPAEAADFDEMLFAQRDGDVVRVTSYTERVLATYYIGQDTVEGDA
jgi:hypothetical protein